MKKHKKTVVKILIILFLFSCVFIPISYASYVSNYNSNPDIDVAKWNIKINNETLNEEFSFDLFETVSNSNIKSGLKAISPGTSGKVELNLLNSSDVISEYTLNVVETSNQYNIPIVYSFEENGEYKKLSELEFPNNEEININEQVNITLYWKWEFYVDSSQNVIDNELGNTENASIKVTINLDANQKIV